MFENKTNLVFIGIFNFLGLKSTSMQSLFHSYQPLSNFFGQVMHFCKYTWVNLMETYLKPLQTFSSLVVYWQALEKTCPNHISWKLSSKLKVSHLRTNLKTLVIVFKLEPLYLKYAIISFFKPYSSKRSVNFFANACFVVSKSSNKPRITCFGFQSNP